MEEVKRNKKKSPIPISIVAAALVIALGILSSERREFPAEMTKKLLLDAVLSPPRGISQNSASSCPLAAVRGLGDERKISGTVLPVVLYDLPLKLFSVGVIDKAKFEALYKENQEQFAAYGYLLSSSNGKLAIDEKNAGIILNIFWALGLGAKSEVLDYGPMVDKRYGGASRFASTAGWTIAVGDAMSHYSRHPFVVLTDEEQRMVKKVAKGIYRPCCDNSVYFPDCNHGMAMLGLLELMASQGVSEQEMYKTALAVNAYWFPDTYLTIAQYLASRGVDWNDADPKEILGANYSSASGYRQILSQVTAPAQKNSGGCGV